MVIVSNNNGISRFPKFLYCAVHVSLWCLLILAQATNAGENIYPDGLVPHHNKSVNTIIWQDVIIELEKKSSCKFSSLVSESFDKLSDPALIECMILPASINCRYMSFKNGEALLRDIAVMRNDSAKVDVTELSGKVMAWPAANAFGSS